MPEGNAVLEKMSSEKFWKIKVGVDKVWLQSKKHRKKAVYVFSSNVAYPSPIIAPK